MRLLWSSPIIRRFAVTALPAFLGVASACGGGPPASDLVATETQTPGLDEERLVAESLSAEWPGTDFTNATVPLTELFRGCPSGRECIPALDAPGAVSVSSERTGRAVFASVADAGIAGDFPVSYITVNGKTHAYPLHILTWHEIVNDVIGGVPIAVTYCPLCNIAIAFERNIDGTTLDFSVTGFLRNSDLVMFDRQTESWWQQATGKAIIGDHAGRSLKLVATPVVAFADFAAAFPDALVLTEDTGFGMQYGVNPYRDYEYGNEYAGGTPFLYFGEYDPRLPPLTRVLTLGVESGDPIAIRYSTLQEHRTVTVDVGDNRVVAFTTGGTRSVLDRSEIAESAFVGSAVAYRSAIDGRELTFAAEAERGLYRDQETGSLWSVTGLAIDGPLAGEALTPVMHTTEFWFAWVAFHPDTRIWKSQ